MCLREREREKEEKRSKCREGNRQEGTRKKKEGKLDTLLWEALNCGTDSFIKL